MQIRLALKLAYAVLFSLSVLPSSFASAQNVRTESISASVPGPLSTQTAEYKFAAVTDTDIMKTAATELWARAFWPTDLSKPRPIVFLLHGNHSTCQSITTKEETNCKYTLEGTCDAGDEVLPNHEGYNYLAQQLASLGYIAVTINANRGITCGGGSDTDWGNNLVRGRLVLRHIEEWMKWSTQGGAPVSLGLAANAFVGKVDLTNVGLVGHSRGGEGMRAALAQYRDAGSIWPARIPNLKIRGIFEIGSVDGQAGRVLDADDTAWNQILPMCDGDVSDLEGRLPFERMMKKSVEGRKTPKSLTMVYGANHNFFNTQWTKDESNPCFEHPEIHGPGPVSQKQQLVASTVLSAFMLANVGADKQPDLAHVFDPAYLLPSALSSVTRVDRDHLYTFDRTYSMVVDDFDQKTGLSSSKKKNNATGIKSKNETTEVPGRAVISWTSASRHHYQQLNMEDKGAGRDVSAFTSLDLRVGRTMDVVKDAATDFSILLVDSKNHVSVAVPISKYADLTGPGSENDLYQTVRIPLKEFALPPGTLVRGVRLMFDLSATGSLHIANVRFTSNNTPVFTTSLNSLLTPLPIVPTKSQNAANGDENENNSLAAAAKVADGANLPATPTPTPSPTPVPVATPIPLALEIAAAVEGLTTFGVGPKPIVANAKLLRAHMVPASKFLNGRAAMEIAIGTVTPGDHFPVEAQLPTLVMSGNRYSVSRYAPTGRTDTMIFTLPKEEFTNLPETGTVFMQYGRTNARKFWKMPNYTKSEIVH